MNRWVQIHTELGSVRFILDILALNLLCSSVSIQDNVDKNTNIKSFHFINFHTSWKEDLTIKLKKKHNILESSNRCNDFDYDVIYELTSTKQFSPNSTHDCLIQYVLKLVNPSNDFRVKYILKDI